MTSSTITEVNTASTSIPLILRFQNPSNTLDEKIGELVSILEKHKNCKDPLSIKIRSWAVKIELPENEEEVLTEKFKEETLKNIQRLFKEILVDPMDGSPLQDPMLDRKDWVWEKWKLQDWLKFSLLSPYDKKPIEAIPHQFANEISTWAKNCSEMMGINTSIETAIIQVGEATHLDQAIVTQNSEQNQFIAMQKVSTYLILAEKAKRLRECENQIAVLVQQKEMFALSAAREREKSNQAIEQAEKFAEAELNEIRTEIDQSTQSQQRTVAILMSRLEVDKLRIDAAEQRATQSENRTAQQELEIAALRKAYAEKEVSTRVVYQEVKKKSKCVIM